MGSSQSRGLQERPINVNHPRFKNTKAFNSANTPLMQTDITTDQHTYQRWRSQIATLKPEKYRFLLMSLRDSNQEKCEICTNRRTITVTYDRFPFLLTDAIQSNRYKKTAFEESQLWQLLYAICIAEAEYGSIRNGSMIGNITPQAIFISQKGKIRVANAFSWPQESKGQQIYLPPEQIQSLRTGTKSSVTPESSQQYSIGLTVLSAGILKQSSDLYDYEKMSFDMPQSKRRMNFWLTRQRYSQNLRILIAYLCNFRASRRWSMAELRNWIGNYRARIGANQLDGSKVELPQRFADDVAQLKTAAPYLAERIAKESDYINEYYFSYKSTQMSTWLFEEHSEANLAQQSSAISLRKTISSKKELIAINEQSPKKIDLTLSQLKQSPKVLVGETNNFEGSLESKNTIQTKYSQVLNGKNAANDIPNIPTTESKIIIQQQASIPNINSKRQAQPIHQPLMNPQSPGNQYLINNQAQKSQISPKQRLGNLQAAKKQYIPPPSPAVRKKITFSYVNPQQKVINIPQAKPTEPNHKQIKQNGQQFAKNIRESAELKKKIAVGEMDQQEFLRKDQIIASSAIQQKGGIHSQQKIYSNKGPAVKPGTKELPRVHQKLKNSRSQQSKGFINNSTVKDPTAKSGATKLYNAKSIPSKLGAEVSPNSSRTIKNTSVEQPSRIIADKTQEPANDLLRKSAIEQLAQNEAISQAKELKQQLDKSPREVTKGIEVQKLLSNDGHCEYKNQDDQRHLQITQNKVIDFITKFEQADKDLVQIDKNLVNKKIVAKKQKSKEQAIQPTDKHKLPSSKSITLLANNLNSGKKTLSESLLPSESAKQPSKAADSKPFCEPCTSLGQCKNPAHHHGQNNNVTYLKPQIELPAAHQQYQTNIKIKSVKQIQPTRVINSKVNSNQQSKIYVAQALRTQVVSYIQESKKIQETVHNQEAKYMGAQVPKIEEPIIEEPKVQAINQVGEHTEDPKIEIQPRDIKEIKDSKAEVTVQMEEPNLEPKKIIEDSTVPIAQVRHIQQSRIEVPKEGNTKDAVQKDKPSQSIPTNQVQSNYNDAIINDLLGFGLQKRTNSQVEKKGQQKPEDKLVRGIADGFIVDVMRTNQLIKQQSKQKL